MMAMPAMQTRIASQLHSRTRSPSTMRPSTAARKGALLMITSTSATEVRLRAMMSAVEATA